MTRFTLKLQWNAELPGDPVRDGAAEEKRVRKSFGAAATRRKKLRRIVSSPVQQLDVDEPAKVTAEDAQLRLVQGR